VAFYNELQKKPLYNLPSHLKSVSALPCEIWITTVQLYTIVLQFKSVTNCLSTVNTYRNVTFWIICLYQLIYNITACVQNIRHQQAGLLWVVHAILSTEESINDALLQFCVKHVAGTVTIYCADMTSNDAISTQKRQLNSNKSIKQKYLRVYHSKTKLSSNVSIILANINE